MAKTKEESVYDFITRMSGENPGLPYDFQHLPVAGTRDVRSAFYPSRYSDVEREKMAMEVVELAASGIKSAAARKLLHKQLDDKPLYLYVSMLMPRLFLLLSEKTIDEKSLYALGYKMATQSSHSEEVKLGLLILGCFENDFVRQIVRVLGLHASFTLFAVEASEKFSDRNEFLFDLVRNTAGYGKIAVLSYFEPILQNQKRWVFDNGAFNEIDPNASAKICIEKADMIKFFGDLMLTKSNFSKLSYLLAYAAEEQPISSLGQGQLLTEKFLNSADLFAGSFIDLAAIAVLKKSMAEKTESENEPDWPAGMADEFSEKCRVLLSQPQWKKAVFRELGNPCQTSSLITLTLSESGILPGFLAFCPMLERDPFDLYLYYFVLVSHPEEYLLDAAVTLKMTLPEELFGEEPQKLPVDSWLPEYKPNTCLVFLLRALRKAHIEDEELFLWCLTARYPDIRFEAILALRVFKNSWSGSVYPALERAGSVEPVKEIEKNIRRLMESAEPEKEQRYAETTGINGTETGRVILYESIDSDTQVIIEAYMTDGALHIDGQDIGKSVEDFWGEDEYEYYYSLSEQETAKLHALLNRESNTDKSLLELIAINFNGNECDVKFREFCENNSIAVEFFSWF